MNLPKEKILFNSHFPKELGNLLELAEKALKEWEPIWSSFLSAQVIDEANNKFNTLNDITCKYEG